MKTKYKAWHTILVLRLNFHLLYLKVYALPIFASLANMTTYSDV